MNEAPENFTLHFGTKPHELDVATLVGSLAAIETVLQELDCLNQGATRISLKVRPFKKGSFEVPVELQHLATATVLSLTPREWCTVADILKMMVELIKLTVLFGGKKKKTVTEEGNSVIIKGTRGRVTYIDRRTYKVFNVDTVVCEALARGFGSLEANKDVKRVKLLDSKRKVLLNVPRRHFPLLKERTIGGPREETTLRERIELTVYKVVFDAGPKWKFIYRGFRVWATIKDADFLAQVTDGEAFAHGDVLDVDLEIAREFDPVSKTYVNKAYNVIKVYRHTRRPRQTPLGLAE